MVTYMPHDFLPLSHQVEQCKRCSVFVMHRHAPHYPAKWVEQDGVELANEPHCVEKA